MNIFKEFLEFLKWLDSMAGYDSPEMSDNQHVFTDKELEFDPSTIGLPKTVDPVADQPVSDIFDNVIISYREAIDIVYGDRLDAQRWCTRCPKCDVLLPIEDRGRCCGDCRSVIGKIAHAYGLIQYNNEHHFDPTMVSRILPDWATVNIHVENFMNDCLSRSMRHAYINPKDYMKFVDLFICNISMKIGVSYDKMLGIRVSEFAKFLEELNPKKDFYNHSLILGSYPGLTKYNNLFLKWEI